MSDTYTTNQVAALCKVNPHTIHRWCNDEFSEYLSPTALPSGSRPRKFTEDDLKTLLLIAQLKDNGATNEDVHAALHNPQRPDLPETLPALSTTPLPEHQRQIVALTGQVQALQAEIEELRKYRDENIALKARLDTMEAQLAKEREIGRLEGELEALKRQIGQGG